MALLTQKQLAAAEARWCAHSQSTTPAGRKIRFFRALARDADNRCGIGEDERASAPGPVRVGIEEGALRVLPAYLQVYPLIRRKERESAPDSAQHPGATSMLLGVSMIGIAWLVAIAATPLIVTLRWVHRRNASKRPR